MGGGCVGMQWVVQDVICLDRCDAGAVCRSAVTGVNAPQAQADRAAAFAQQQPAATFGPIAMVDYILEGRGGKL